MVRVCMVAYTSYQYDNRVRREAEALVERGDAVDVISLGKRDEANPEYENGVRIIKILLPRYQGSSSKMYVSSYLYFFCAALLKLTWRQFKYSYQVIQVHTMPDFMVFTAIVPRLLGAKVILDVHDLMPELYQSKFGSTKWSPSIIRFITWVERCSIGFAHRAIAVHQPHLEALCRHGNPSRKFTVLLNCPDMKNFTNQGNSQSRNRAGLELIYHGTVAKRNGLEIAIRAISTLKNDLKQLKLRIYGFGDDLLHLGELINELELKDNVQIGLPMPLAKLVPIIQEVDVGIVPILYDEFSRYMLPVKLLEYVAMGKPVICSRTEAIETYFNESMVRFVTPGSVSELAGAIRELYEHPEKRKLLSTAANQFTRENNWEKQKQKYYQLIDGLVNK